MTTFPIKTKVLYFPRNTRKNKINYMYIYTSLKSMFADRTTITVDEVDKYLQTTNERFYIKELQYQLEIYNLENEYIYCINKPIN